MPQLIAIAAMSSNRVIGRAGALPWHYPEDLQFFKRITFGHPILMGRNTFESIGRPLPGRLNIVLSKTQLLQEKVTVIRDVKELEQIAPPEENVFVIGGAKVYQALLPKCSLLYLTWVKAECEGDTFFPVFEHLFRLRIVLNSTPELEFRLYERLPSSGETFTP